MFHCQWCAQSIHNRVAVAIWVKAKHNIQFIRTNNDSFDSLQFKLHFIMVEVRLFEEDFNFSVLLSVVPVGRCSIKVAQTR